MLEYETAMPLTIKIGRSEGPRFVVKVELAGSLDTTTAPELERQLVPILAGTIKDMVFDLVLLKFVSSAGIRIFAKARKVMKERGGQASFIRLQPQIKEVFDIIQALPGLNVFRDEVEMDAYLAARQRTHDSKP